MADQFRKSTRDYIYRQQGISPTARAVLKEEIHYNEKLSKMISIYAFTEMFYADRYTVDGKVDKEMYDKLRGITEREYTESCLSSLAYQVKALPIINFTRCSKLERHIVVALSDLRKTHTEEYRNKIEDYMWEAKKQTHMITDLVKSVKQQYVENSQTKTSPAANQDYGMER